MSEETTVKTEPSEYEKEFDAAVDSALRGARRLERVAHYLGLNPLQGVIAMQVATMFMLEDNPQIHEEYEKLIEPIRKMARDKKVPFTPASTKPPAEDLPAFTLVDRVLEISPDSFQPKFPLGKLEISVGALMKVDPRRIVACLVHHGNCEWGPFVSDEDLRQNHANVREGKSIVYSIHRIYDSRNDDDINNKFYILTQADRLTTNVILPEEY